VNIRFIAGWDAASGLGRFRVCDGATATPIRRRSAMAEATGVTEVTCVVAL